MSCSCKSSPVYDCCCPNKRRLGQDCALKEEIVELEALKEFELELDIELAEAAT